MNKIKIIFKIFIKFIEIFKIKCMYFVVIFGLFVFKFCFVKIIVVIINLNLGMNEKVLILMFICMFVNILFL